MTNRFQVFFPLFLLLCSFVAITVVAAEPHPTVVGVNAWYMPANASSEEMIKQLGDNHVRTLRVGLSDKSLDFIIQAYRNGIGAIVIVYPGYGSTAKPKHSWADVALSEINSESFATWFRTMLDKLDAAGVSLTAIEIGNEINTSGYNGDIPSPGSGRILGVSDLNNPNDREASAIAKGYRVYLTVLAAAKDMRDHSQMNKTTPLISAGMGNLGPPSTASHDKQTGVSITDSIEYLRQNGLERLVDGYGVHVYPGLDPSRSVSVRITSLGHDIFAACSKTKPCWLTEWGVPDGSEGKVPEHCPIDETKRSKVIEELHGAFHYFVNEGTLAGIIFYDWSDQPGNTGAIFRCGGLTDAGRLALSPM